MECISSLKVQSKNPKLFEIFSFLSSKEQKVFTKHVEKNHSQDSDTAKLIRALYKNRGRINIKSLSRQFKEEYFSRSTAKAYSNLLSKVKCELEDWLICHDLRASQYERRLALIKAYNKRGVYSEANIEAGKLHTLLRSDTKYDLSKSKAMHLLKDYQYYSDNPIKYKEGAKLLEEVVDNFNSYYKAVIHLYNAELHNWGRICKHDFSQLIKSNLERANSLSETELSSLTIKLESLIEDHDLEAFYEIYELLLNGKVKEHTAIHAICCNYSVTACVHFIRSKTLIDNRILTNLYDYGLRSGGFLQEGRLTLNRFHNIISAMASVNGYEEVDAFIDKWIHVVESKLPESTRMIAKVQNCFYHEKYDKIFDHLRVLKFENISQKFRALKFEMVAQYEIGNYDLLSRTIHNYTRSLKRHKDQFSKRFYLINVNLIKILNHLMKDDKEFVAKLLNSNQPIILREWIGEKIG